jgi:hypothetical protein
MGLKPDSPVEFRTLVHEEMKFYLRAYLDIPAVEPNPEQVHWVDNIHPPPKT